MRIGVRRLLLVLPVAAVALASPASGHTRLVSSTPVDGAVLATAPSTVVLRFAEDIEPALSTVSLLGPAAGTVRPLARAARTSSTDLVVAVPRGLAAGGYAVAWQVAGEDGHAVTGRVSFRVEQGPVRPTVATPVAAAEKRDGGGSRDVYGGARWLALLGFCAASGAVLFVAFCAPGPASRRRVLRLGGAGLGLLTGSSVVALAAYGPAVAGLSLRQLDGDVLRAAVSSRVGTELVVRVLLCVGAGGYVVAWRRGAVRCGPVLGLVWTAAVASTWSLAGHSRSGALPALMVPLDVVHLSASAMWLGGVAALIASGRAVEGAVVRRFSPVAATCVLLIVLTGSVQAWQRVGSSAALADNAYGRLLLVKVALVVAALCVAAFVRHRLHATPSFDVPVRRGVALEAALGVTVLAVTTALVAAEPAATSHSRLVAARIAAKPALVPVAQTAAAEVVTAEIPLDAGAGRVLVQLVPRTGPVDVHLSVVTGDGRPQAARVRAALRPVGDTGTGIALPMERLGVGHFTGTARVPSVGRWELGVALLLPDGRRTAARATFTVR